MSASERLRELDGAWREAIYFQRKTGIPFQVKAALPLIADVVEAAEAVDDPENDTSEARRFVRGPLTALRDALEEK